MLVIEGPDGGGKTTLAKELAEIFHLDYRKPPPELLSSESGPVDPRGLQLWWQEELARCENSNAYSRKGVYDRCTYISDPIYRLIYHTPSGSTTDEMGQGIAKLANFGNIIFCLPGLEETWAALGIDPERKNLITKRESHEVLYWAYYCQYHLWKEASFEYVELYDWRNKDYIVEWIKENAL